MYKRQFQWCVAPLKIGVRTASVSPIHGALYVFFRVTVDVCCMCSAFCGYLIFLDFGTPFCDSRSRFVRVCSLYGCVCVWGGGNCTSVGVWFCAGLGVRSLYVFLNLKVRVLTKQISVWFTVSVSVCGSLY